MHGRNCNNCESRAITKEGLINKVAQGTSVTIKDMDGDSFNISKVDGGKIKIYPLISVNFAPIWYKYAGKLLYPANYDSRWVDKHTILESLLGDLLI